ncbi:MAG: DMT family transporter [Neomegalonema sp.]|nr:DMT family transporter [Neomegalonema sp.]
MRILLLTTLAMIAFAANSVLTRAALAPDLIDPASFSSIRIAAGALTLGAIAAVRGAQLRQAANWRMALALFTYVACFSFAYRWLDAGVGALILFGAVQISMLAVGFIQGERLSAPAWLGLLLAVGGLGYLLSPDSPQAPNLAGAGLMIIAGVAWGGYSLLGRGVASPLNATTASFVLALPATILLSTIFADEARATLHGGLLAIASGALASGCGYVVWYAALPGLTATQAATVQLSAPVIAAYAGAALIAEPITARLILASALVLGGIALIVTQRSRSRRA